MKSLNATRYEMLDIDLDALTLDELKSLQKEVAKAITSFEA
jgi:hypothetical protein